VITPEPPSLRASLFEHALVERARVEGDLVKVDDFLNHRIELPLVMEIGSSLALRFAGDAPDLVLTAEASGIAPALATAAALDLPAVYAKKYPREEAARPAFVRTVVSPTKGAAYRIEVARRVLEPALRVLVVDDFLSRGRTAEALGEIVEEADATVVGFGFALEKSFMEGRRRLEDHGWRVESLVRIARIDGGLGFDM
jgi:xanthine phosphoribosyltransferase